MLLVARHRNARLIVQRRFGACDAEELVAAGPVVGILLVPVWVLEARVREPVGRRLMAED
jgi:hypothetical protein